MIKKNKFDFFDSFNSKVLRSLRNRFDKNNMFKSINDFKNQIASSFDIESDWFKKKKNATQMKVDRTAHVCSPLWNNFKKLNGKW